MSRKLPVEYPGAMNHAMNRGDQREDIFAARLQMGDWTYVSNLLNEPRKPSRKLSRCDPCQ